MINNNNSLRSTEILMQTMDFAKQNFSIKEYKTFIEKAYSIKVNEQDDICVEGYRSILNNSLCFRVVDFCDSVLLKFVGDLESFDNKELMQYKWILAHSEKICDTMMKNYNDNLNNEKFVKCAREYEVTKTASDKVEELTKLKANMHFMKLLNKDENFKLEGLTYSECEQQLAEQKTVLAEHPYTTQSVFAGMYHKSVCDNKNRLENYTRNICSVKNHIKDIEKSRVDSIIK